jgi:hypothetical protein
MKKLNLLFLILISATVLLAQESIAISLKVNGDVNLTRAEKISSLQTGFELYSKDLLESNEDSFAAIKFIDGSTIVKLFPRSILEIFAVAEKGKLNKRSKLDLGELWSRVDPGSGDYEVETPTTVVSVKGTQFLLEVDENGATTLYTVTGKVEMKNKTDEQVVLVNEGEKAYSTGTGLIEVLPYDLEEIEENTEDIIEKTQTLEIKLENAEGEEKTIFIELE